MKRGKSYLKGQIAVVMTLVMAVLLGACALGADVAVLYYNWAMMQKAADSAVLAGANYLTGASDTDTALVTTTVKAYAQDNGVLSKEITNVTVDPNWEWVSVTINRSVPYYFGRLLGLSQGGVQVYAKAGIHDTSAPLGVTPIGLECPAADAGIANCNGLYPPYAPGAKAQSLFYKFTTVNAPGNWDGIALGANGVSAWNQNVISGYNGAPLKVGTWVPTETGNGLVNAFAGDFATKLQNAGETYPPPNLVPPANPSTSDPQVILVPLVDYAGVTGKKQVQVEGFAEMYVVPGSQCNNPLGDLCAYFLKELPNNGIPTVNACSAVDAGQVVDNGGVVKINSCTPVLID